MGSTQSSLRSLAGIVAGALIAGSLSAAPALGDEPPTPLPNVEMQARTNLLVLQGKLHEQVAWSTEEPKGAYINTNLLVPEGKLHGLRRSERGFFTHIYSR